MEKYRWHRHYSDTSKTIANKIASQLRRKSFWRNDPKFKVRVEQRHTKAPRSGKMVKHYVVEWYGKDHAI